LLLFIGWGFVEANRELSDAAAQGGEVIREPFKVGA